MEKNVMIIDNDGNLIGFTYPKRAKGLVKKGRAEPVSENCIKITDTQVPTVDTDSEENRMSKVIGFEARSFRIDPTCKGNNIANRMFVTDALGNNVEIYEIGSFGHDWTQISCEIPVEKNEDYEFLFAVSGDINEAMSGAKKNFIIMPIHEKPKVKSLPDLSSKSDDKNETDPGNSEITKGTSIDGQESAEDPGKDDWENRYQYSLLNRDYRPTMEKAWNGSSLRFYRIPFNTGDADKIRFVFVAFQRPYKIFPVKNFEEYDGLPDFEPERDNSRYGRNPGFGAKNQSGNKNGWNWNWNRGNAGSGNGASGWYSGPKDFKDAEKVLNNLGAIVSNAVKEAMENFSKFQKDPFGWRPDDPGKGPKANRNNYSSKNSDFDKNGMFKGNGAGTGNKKVDPDMLTFILKKLDEDDGRLDLANCDIECGKDFVPGSDEDCETVDDILFSLDNSRMDGDAFYRIMSKVGNDCKVEANNCIIGDSANGPELAGGFESRSDDCKFSFVNSQLSEAAFISLVSKIGDDCKVDLSNSNILDFEAIDDLSGFCCDTFDDTEIRLDNTRISQRQYQMLVRACGNESKVVGRAVIV